MIETVHIQIPRDARARWWAVPAIACVRWFITGCLRLTGAAIGWILLHGVVIERPPHA